MTESELRSTIIAQAMRITELEQMLKDTMSYSKPPIVDNPKKKNVKPFRELDASLRAVLLYIADNDLGDGDSFELTTRQAIKILIDFGFKQPNDRQYTIGFGKRLGSLADSTKSISGNIRQFKFSVKTLLRRDGEDNEFRLTMLNEAKLAVKKN
jgi:hypothetical protein